MLKYELIKFARIDSEVSDIGKKINRGIFILV